MTTIEDLHPTIKYLEGLFDAAASLIPRDVDADGIIRIFYDTLEDMEGDLQAIWHNREAAHMDERETLRDRIIELEIQIEKLKRKEIAEADKQARDEFSEKLKETCHE